MTLQKLIAERKFLNDAQEFSLYTLLSSGCSQGTQREIKNVLRYQFYSKFDGKWFAKHFIVREDWIEFIGDKSKEISKIRKELLGDTE